VSHESTGFPFASNGPYVDRLTAPIAAASSFCVPAIHFLSRLDSGEDRRVCHDAVGAHERAHAR
jgi:hypothetical protein